MELEHLVGGVTAPARGVHRRLRFSDETRPPSGRLAAIVEGPPLPTVPGLPNPSEAVVVEQLRAHNLHPVVISTGRQDDVLGDRGAWEIMQELAVPVLLVASDESVDDRLVAAIHRAIALRGPTIYWRPRRRLLDPLARTVGLSRGGAVEAGRELPRVTVVCAYVPAGVVRMVVTILDQVGQRRFFDAMKEIVSHVSFAAERADLSRRGPLSGEEGGSYAIAEPMTYFVKEAVGIGVQKLADEARFLRMQRPPLAAYYPAVRSFERGEDRARLEIERFSLRSTRALLFDITVDPSLVLQLFEDELGPLLEMMYGGAGPAPPDDFLDQFHFFRLWRRLRDATSRSPRLARLIRAERIVLNGEEHVNVAANALSIEADVRMRSLLSPRSVSELGHGDLHLANILADPEERLVKLVDPRGYPYCDRHYDFGKLLHSTHGLYDFLHDGRFEVSDADVDDRTVAAELRVPVDSVPMARFASAQRAVERLVSANGEPCISADVTFLRSLFSEAMHFCTDAPFHLGRGKGEETAAAIYFTGVTLLSAFVASAGVRPVRSSPEQTSDRIAHAGVLGWRFQG